MSDVWLVLDNGEGVESDLCSYRSYDSRSRNWFCVNSKRELLYERCEKKNCPLGDYTLAERLETLL